MDDWVLQRLPLEEQNSGVYLILKLPVLHIIFLFFRHVLHLLQKILVILCLLYFKLTNVFIMGEPRTCIPPLMASGVPSPLTSVAENCFCERDGTHDSQEYGAVASPSSLLYYTSIPSTVRIGDRCVLHNDLAELSIGEYSILANEVVLRPSIRIYVNRSTASAAPNISIGAFTYLGEGTVCEALEVGKMVRVDAQCIIGSGARLGDGVWLKPRTWIPPDVSLCPYTVYEGAPAVPVGKLNSYTYRLMHLEFLRQCRGT